MHDAHYPINFVVKHPNLLALSRRPALRRLETCQVLRWPVSKSASLTSNGGDWATANEIGGAERDRTADLMLAKHALSQLSYSPMMGACGKVVGLGRFELPTSPLSGVRSNQLSYRPALATPRRRKTYSSKTPAALTILIQF